MPHFDFALPLPAVERREGRYFVVDSALNEVARYRRPFGDYADKKSADARARAVTTARDTVTLFVRPGGRYGDAVAGDSVLINASEQARAACLWSAAERDAAAARERAKRDAPRPKSQVQQMVEQRIASFAAKSSK